MMGDGSRLSHAILDAGPGRDVPAGPVRLGLRHINAHVSHEHVDSCSEN